MRKGLALGLWALALVACADDPQPTGVAAANTAEAALTDDGDWGEAEVAAEWAAFEAAPGTKPGLNVVDPALARILEGALPDAQLEVIVSYDRTQTTGGALATRLHALGAGTIGFKHLPMVFAIGTPAAVREIAAQPGVESVYQNRRLEYLLYESTKAIRADAVWTYNGLTGYTGKGVGVAILDSGVDGLYNPGLAFPTKTVANVKFIGSVKDLVTFDDSAPVKPAGELYLENVSNSETSSGHGTHVAGIAGGDGSGSSAGIYRGVAPGSNIVGIGSGDVLFIFWILAGFDYLLDNQQRLNIKVVNNSWGSEGAFDPNDPINKATRIVHDAGVTVVFAAGNSGPDQNTMNPYSVAPWVISVAAGCKVGVQDPTNSASHCVDPQGRDPVLADFSSRGIPGDKVYQPDVTAPGVHIVSTRSSLGAVINALAANHDVRICNISTQHLQYYTCIDGTSMAAPHVAGVVALLQEAAGNRLTPDQVLGILKKSSRRLTGFQQFEVGSGFVDAYAAVRKVVRR